MLLRAFVFICMGIWNIYLISSTALMIEERGNKTSQIDNSDELYEENKKWYVG